MVSGTIGSARVVLKVGGREWGLTKKGWMMAGSVNTVRVALRSLVIDHTSIGREAGTVRDRRVAIASGYRLPVIV